MSDWDGIDEFVAVAIAGSFTRGARSIGRSLTHVSRAVMLLERRLDIQLLVRTTRSVRLTDTGRTFYERCLRMTQDRDEAIAFIGEGGDPRGELRVTCAHAIGERFVAPILRRFAMRHPKLRVSIELSNRVTDLVAEGYDLAIRTGASTDPKLIVRRVAGRNLHTCASVSYLDRTGRPERVDDLARHDCILGTSTTWHFDIAGRTTLLQPGGRFRCNSGYAAVEACLSGLGICQLPEFYILPHLRRGELELVLEDFRPPEEPIWVAYPHQRHLLPKISHAVDCLERELGPALQNASDPTGQYEV